MNKVVIVGCGNVGMSYAYALIVGGSNIDELVLIDINKDRAEGEAMDLSHAVPYAPHNMRVYAGDYSDCNDATIIALCAGRNQEIGETRMDLISKNYDVFASIISEISKTNFDGIYLVATNPLDVMTYFTHKLSGFAPHKVVGSGTTLDSARLRHLISEEINISPKNIHAYVIGEHGDSEFIPWSTAMIGLTKMDEFLTENQKSHITYNVKTSAYDIINKKGNTSYGIGMSMLKVTNALLSKETNIMTVSAYNQEHDIYFAMPTLINTQGVVKSLHIELNQHEANLLTNSIDEIKKIKYQVIKEKGLNN